MIHATLLSQTLPDLPYDSGSTGVDGPLKYRTFLPGRNQHAMVFDEEHKEIVVFGGYRDNCCSLADTWTWNGSSWTNRTPAQNPSSRYNHAAAYDADTRQVILFGGYNGQAPYGYGGDTWAWNGTNWTQLFPATSPSARSGHAMAYDAERRQVVLYGGYDPTVGNLGDTWLWDGITWSQASPGTAPGRGSRHSMAYDSERKVIVLFSGLDSLDYQTYTWDGSNWTAHMGANHPPRLYDYSMGYDQERHQIVLFGGIRVDDNKVSADTWAWDGSFWTQLSSATAPSGRSGHKMAYDSEHKQIVLTGGNGSNSADTWTFDGSTWIFWSSDGVTFDMSAKADGIWNFTTIDIPAGVTLYFQRNPANTAVRWLASGNVTINGFLSLNGENGSNNPNPGNEAKGGPGGYAGGLGAVRFDQSSSYTGSPGQGPGGGSPGVGAADGYNGGQRFGQPGKYADTYGNAYIQPLLGGSGGGGGGSGYSDIGGNGGGGGGAILISSSRDIVVNGGISASGGSGGNYGGSGSGGAIRLVADRISGGGSLQANGGGQGRIRLEAYYRPLAGNTSPVSSISAPVTTRSFDALGSLIIAKVAGQVVDQPPRGDSTNPDVLFTAAGDITIEVQGTGIPDNTPVTLRIGTVTGVINKPAPGEPAVNIVGGTASFTVTVPPGIGSIQAFAQFTQQ